MLSNARATGLLVLGLAASCSDATVPDGPIAVTIQNSLLVAVTVSSLGDTLATIPAEQTATVTLPEGRRSFDWTANNRGPLGLELLDDFGTTTVTANAPMVLELTNVVNVVTTFIYFTPRVINNSGNRLSVAISSGSILRCLGTQPDGNETTWGYYRLTAGTQLRVYPATDSCSGNFAALSGPAILPMLEPKSGLLTVDVTPVP